MEFSDHSEKSFDDLLHKESFTPEELATLLDMNVNVIRTACFEGKLNAQIVNHDIVSIARNDVLTWIATR